MAGNKSWKTVRGQRDLNAGHVRDFGRLMAAEEALADVCDRRGLSQDLLSEQLDPDQAGLAEAAAAGDLYLTTLFRYVAALGGHVEIQAVFADETVTVLNSDREQK